MAPSCVAGVGRAAAGRPPPSSTSREGLDGFEAGGQVGGASGGRRGWARRLTAAEGECAAGECEPEEDQRERRAGQGGGQGGPRQRGGGGGQASAAETPPAEARRPRRPSRSGCRARAGLSRRRRDGRRCRSA